MLFKIIFSISILLLFLLLFFLIIITYKKRQIALKDYEIVTKPSISYLVATYFFLVIGLGFSIADVVISFFNENIGFWVCFGCGMFFNIISFILLFDLYLDIEAYKDKKIYVWRFFNKKVIDVSKVEYILNFGVDVKFLDKRREKLFGSGSVSNGTELIIEKIKEDHIVYDNLNESVSLEEIKKNADEITIQKYESFGKELRENKDASIKSFKLGYMLVMLIIILICLSLIIFDSIVNIIYMVPFFFLGPIVYFIFLGNYQKKYDLDDFELGYLHYKDCKSYIGHSKYVYKGRKLNCLIWIIFGLVMGIPMSLISLTFKPSTYEGLIQIEGTLEYSYEKGTLKDNYIAFGIEEDDIEYRLSSFYADNFKLDFYDSANKGDKVMFYAASKTISGTNYLTKEKTDVQQIYYVKCNDIEWFSYDDYVNAEIENNNVAKIASYVFFAITLLASSIMTICYIKYKKNEKLEYRNI